MISYTKIATCFLCGIVISIGLTYLNEDYNLAIILCYFVGFIAGGFAAHWAFDTHTYL